MEKNCFKKIFFADWKKAAEGTEGGNNQVNESSFRSISSFTLEAFTSEFMRDFHFPKALDSSVWSHGMVVNNFWYFNSKKKRKSLKNSYLLS